MRNALAAMWNMFMNLFVMGDIFVEAGTELAHATKEITSIARQEATGLREELAAERAFLSGELERERAQQAA